MLSPQKPNTLTSSLVVRRNLKVKGLQLNKGVGFILAGLIFFFLPISRTVAQTAIPLQPVQPSLWWASERFGQNLVEDLRLDPANQTVQIAVNAGVWSTWDYLKRYALIQQLGRVAIAQNFGIQILDGRKNKLVQYVQINGSWQVQPPLLGANPYRIYPDLSRNFFAQP